MALIVYLFLLALLFALLEIQIEGREGWAKNLPAWRPHPQSRMAILYRRFMSGKELTGYHAVMFTLVFFVFLFPYVWGARFDLTSVVKTLSLFFLFIVLWDFLWFVCNPHYPLRQFRKGFIPWHSNWFWRAPQDYYYGVLFSFIFAFVGALFINADFILWWLRIVIFFTVQTLVVVFITLYILDIDNWKR